MIALSLTPSFLYLPNSELHFCQSESRRRPCLSLSQWALLIATSCRTHRDPALSDNAGEILKFRSVVTLHWSQCWQCSLPQVQWVFLHIWQKSRVHRSSLHHCCGSDWMNEEPWHKSGLYLNDTKPSLQPAVLCIPLKREDLSWHQQAMQYMRSSLRWFGPYLPHCL